MDGGWGWRGWGWGGERHRSYVARTRGPGTSPPAVRRCKCTERVYGTTPLAHSAKGRRRSDDGGGAGRESARVFARWDSAEAIYMQTKCVCVGVYIAYEHT
jgi:hypothetical protein